MKTLDRYKYVRVVQETYEKKLQCLHMTLICSESMKQAEENLENWKNALKSTGMKVSQQDGEVRMGGEKGEIKKSVRGRC